jgi:hypothetical protein
MAMRDLDGPDERATHRLAAAIHWNESDDVAISWNAQVRAGEFYNLHGLSKTLDEARRLEAELERKKPKCFGCGHVCPTDKHCERCGGDPLLDDDQLCVTCVRDTPPDPEPSNPEAEDTRNSWSMGVAR